MAYLQIFVNLITVKGNRVKGFTIIIFVVLFNFRELIN